MFLPWGLEDLTGPVARSDPVHPLIGASRPSRPSIPTSIFSSTSTSLSHLQPAQGSLWDLEDLASRGGPDHLLALSSQWDPPKHERPETDRHESESLWCSDSSDDVIGRVFTLSPFMPAFPSFPGFPKWPCQEQNFKTRQPECVLTVHWYTQEKHTMWQDVSEGEKNLPLTLLS